MLRWLGAGLILSAALLTRRTLVGERRERQRTRRALAAAFSDMEAEIHALLTPLPDLLNRCRDPEAELFFSSLSAAMRQGKSPDTAWRDAVEALSLPEEEKTALMPLGGRLGGDESGICGALALAAGTLRADYDEAERRRGQEERLTTAFCLGGGLLLIILLY